MAAVENIVREALSGGLARQLGTSAPMMRGGGVTMWTGETVCSADYKAA
jgi:hypothetical protein